MAQYFIRVELHEIGALKPTADTYTSLHNALKAKTVERIVRAGDGKSYHLPTGLYTADWANTTARGVGDFVTGIVNTVWSKSTVFAIESRDWAGNNQSVAQ